MPMPKPKKPEDLSINGKKAKKLVKVEKSYKKSSKAYIPDIYNKMVELAEKNKEPKK
jgi:hypothetical protein